MTLEQLKSAIYNDLVGGLRGISTNLNISLEQLEDDIIDERLAILKEYSLSPIICFLILSNILSFPFLN